jgi:Phosphate transport regulator (distant homolog of PhoU)
MRVVSRLIRDLAGSSGERFVNYLLGQTDAAIEGAQLVRRCVAGEIGRATAAEEMRVVEHRGDQVRGELVRDLGSALVTPIDREDLFRLSRSLDDVLDVLRDFVRQWDLFEMDRSEIIEPVMDATCDALVDLRQAIATIGAEPRMITMRALSAKKSGNAIRRSHDTQLAALYRGTLSVDTLKARDLLRRLDVVGIRFGTVADTLSDAAIKRAES